MGLNMDAKKLKEVVDDYPAWKGNSYAIAALVAAAQREESAQMAEAEGQQDLADRIRAG